MHRLIWWTGGLWLGAVLVGCGGAREAPGTGAKECVRAYFEALVQNDMARAYTSLDPQTQKRWSLSRFEQLARQYRTNVGFDPDTVHFRSCEERGNEATAHVVLTGGPSSQEHRFKDAVSLRRGEEGWRVVLAP